MSDIAELMLKWGPVIWPLVRDVVALLEGGAEPESVVKAIKDSLTAAADLEMKRELGG